MPTTRRYFEFDDLELGSQPVRVDADLPCSDEIEARKAPRVSTRLHDDDGLAALLVIGHNPHRDNSFPDDEDRLLLVQRRRMTRRLKRLWDEFADVELTWRKLGADTLRYWLSGAASDGAAQADPTACLGGYRSSTEADRVGLIKPAAMAGVRVDQISRATAADADYPTGLGGTLVALDGNRLAFTARGGSVGPPKSFAVGQSRPLADGTNPSKFVRVTRTGSDPLLGLTALELDDVANNLFGGPNASNTNTTAGRTLYAECRLRGESNAAPVRSIRVWIKPLAASAVSSVTQLGGSGTGTIAGTAYCFAGWQETGWAWIYTSGGTLREIVYYTSRTDSVLTVSAAGHRGRLGTSAAAGASTDVVYNAAGMRIGFETPSPVVGGSVQTIASATTAPTGISWNTGVTESTGLGPVNLPTGGSVGLWLQFDLPAGANGFSRHLNLLGVSFTVSGISYTETLGGIWRAAKTALDRYEFYYGTDAEPDLSAAPASTSASLPWTPTTDFSAAATYRLVVQKRNAYNVVTQSMDSTALTISGGVHVGNPPTAPQVYLFEAAAAGAVRVAALYAYALDADADRADIWAVYLKTGGADPDPDIDTPTEFDMSKAFGASALDETIGAYADGTIVKVLVRAKRLGDGVESTNTTASGPIEATTSEPSAPSGSAHSRGVERID